MIFAIGRFAAVSVAAKVRHYYGEFLGEDRRQLAPFQVRFGIAVEEQRRRALPAINAMDGCAGGADLLAEKAGKEIGFLGRLLPSGGGL
ncbi:MAG TPA: hypothetical protein VGS20_13330 [Candidatus Acidoferrales bacterium]|nr:hypothetical protein [Candidatus Acidoferrales bacterium]